MSHETPIQSELIQSITKEAKFIILSLAIGLVFGSGAVLLHMQTIGFSSIIVMPIVGFSVFGYMALLTKFTSKAPKHYALMLIMMIFSFITTLLIK